MSDDSEPDSCFCNQCLRKTRHKVLHSVERAEDNEGFQTMDQYQIIECQGCAHISYRTQHWTSDMMDYDGPYTRDTYYPPPISRRIPEWLGRLPLDIQSVLREVYPALHAESRYLATIGARTALDLLIKDKIGDVGSFTKKVATLVEDRIITEPEAELIKAVVEAGHASTHRGYAPDSREINHVMDILEAILDKLYIAEERQQKLKAQAADLMKRIPPRNS